MIQIIKAPQKLKIKQVPLEDIDINKGIIVCVYEAQVAILTDYSLINGDTGVFYSGNNHYHTASQNKVMALKRVLENKEASCDIYQFENWAEFAQAVIENGWK